MSDLPSPHGVSRVRCGPERNGPSGGEAEPSLGAMPGRPDMIQIMAPEAAIKFFESATDQYRHSGCRTRTPILQNLIFALELGGTFDIL
jgi:hypothetical protein